MLARLRGAEIANCFQGGSPILLVFLGILGLVDQQIEPIAGAQDTCRSVVEPASASHCIFSQVVDEHAVQRSRHLVILKDNERRVDGMLGIARSWPIW